MDENRLIESIIEMLDDRNDRDTHDNAARLLIEILRVSRDNSYAPPSERFDDPLLATLEAPETVDLLLNVMFRSRDKRYDAIFECSNGKAPLGDFLLQKQGRTE